MTEQKQPYLVFEEGDKYNRERWFVVESKAKAIHVLVYGYARNVLPIDQETYNKYKKLEEVISSAQWEMYDLEKPYQDAMHYDESFFNDPEYQKAYKFHEMWREAHAMNHLFDYKKKWGTSVVEQEEVEPLAEWEKELIGLINKETE
jgi:hypothetical protein